MDLQPHDAPTWGAKLAPWGEDDNLETQVDFAGYDVVWSPPSEQTRIPKPGSSQTSGFVLEARIPRGPKKK